MADDMTTAEVLAAVTEGEEQVGEQQVAEPTTEAEAVDWAAKYEADKAAWEAQVSEYESRIRPYQDYFAKLEASSLQQITDKVLGAAAQTDEMGQTAVTEQEKQLVTSLVREGAVFRQAREEIIRNDLALTAINLAHEIIGDRGTTLDLKNLAADITRMGASFLDNPMAAKALMKRYTDTLKTQRRGDVAQRRVASGVDSVTRASAQTGIATDESVLVQKVADGTASKDEEQRLQVLWAAKRRQVAY